MKGYLVILKINIFPENSECLWWIGKKKGAGNAALGVETYPESGKNGRQDPPSNLKGAPSAPGPGAREAPFSSTEAEGVASERVQV